MAAAKARASLFCDTALAVQVPYARPDSPIASYTIAKAEEAGWMWDIGLASRRGVGYVYSSSHTDDERAERVLRTYLGEAAAGLTPRKIGFNAGYREINWKKNCVAIGLSSGFFEPLEATGIMGHVTEYSPAEIQDFLERSGFASVQTKTRNVYDKANRIENYFWKIASYPFPNMRETIISVCRK